MRYAVISNGRVVNVILWDGEAEYEAGPDYFVIDCAPEVGIGWAWNNDDSFVPPVISEDPA